MAISTEKTLQYFKNSLSTAIENGQLSEVKEVWNTLADYSVEHLQHISILNNAFKNSVKYGQLPLVEFFLSQGANVNFDFSHKESVITYCIQNEDVLTFELLLSHNLKPSTALMLAFKKNYQPIIDIIIEQQLDKDLNKEDIVQYLCISGELDLLKHYLPQAPNFIPQKVNGKYKNTKSHLCIDTLMDTITNNNVNTLDYIIEQGFDPNYEEDFLFRHAVGYLKMHVVEHLITKHGAKVDAAKNYALYSAVNKGSTELLELLYEHGADLSVIQNKGDKDVQAWVNRQLLKVNLDETLLDQPIQPIVKKTKI